MRERCGERRRESILTSDTARRSKKYSLSSEIDLLRNNTEDEGRSDPEVKKLQAWSSALCAVSPSFGLHSVHF